MSPLSLSPAKALAQPKWHHVLLKRRFLEEDEFVLHWAGALEDHMEAKLDSRVRGRSKHALQSVGRDAFVLNDEKDKSGVNNEVWKMHAWGNSENMSWDAVSESVPSWRMTRRLIRCRMQKLEVWKNFWKYRSFKNECIREYCAHVGSCHLL